MQQLLGQGQAMIELSVLVKGSPLLVMTTIVWGNPWQSFFLSFSCIRMKAHLEDHTQEAAVVW
jgi:hypothetical protein